MLAEAVAAAQRGRTAQVLMGEHLSPAVKSAVLAAAAAVVVAPQAAAEHRTAQAALVETIMAVPAVVPVGQPRTERGRQARRAVAAAAPAVPHIVVPAKRGATVATAPIWPVAGRVAVVAAVAVAVRIRRRRPQAMAAFTAAVAAAAAVPEIQPSAKGGREPSSSPTRRRHSPAPEVSLAPLVARILQHGLELQVAIHQMPRTRNREG